MTTTTREAEIVVHGDVPAITITREFAAAPEKVFRAHTDPEWFVRWVGPDSLETCVVDVWDCRPGGSWRYVSEGSDEQHWFRGCFHDVRPNELIVQTFAYEGFPDRVALERLELTDLGNGRTLLTAMSILDSFEGRDALVSSGMETGIQEGYRKLDTLLAEEDA